MAVYLATTWWIWCDIDGSGRCWRLAVEREDGMLYFSVEDFEEHQEVFERYPSVEVECPDETPTVRCSVCKELRPATEDWTKYQADEPVCKKCFKK